jgi:hypothetical protein
LQLILLSTASQREDGHFLPLPNAAVDKAAAANKALATLLKKGFAAEANTKERSQQWREDGEQRIGLVITEAGLKAIGAESKGEEDPAQAPAPVNHEPKAFRPGTKAARLIELLSRKEGARLDDMIEATGWLPHTARAALTGLRKKGHNVVREQKDGTSIYRIESGAVA